MTYDILIRINHYYVPRSVKKNAKYPESLPYLALISHLFGFCVSVYDVRRLLQIAFWMKMIHLEVNK